MMSGRVDVDAVESGLLVSSLLWLEGLLRFSLGGISQLDSFRGRELFIFGSSLDMRHAVRGTIGTAP